MSYLQKQEGKQSQKQEHHFHRQSAAEHADCIIDHYIMEIGINTDKKNYGAARNYAGLLETKIEELLNSGVKTESITRAINTLARKYSSEAFYCDRNKNYQSALDYKNKEIRVLELLVGRQKKGDFPAEIDVAKAALTAAKYAHKMNSSELEASYAAKAANILWEKFSKGMLWSETEVKNLSFALWILYNKDPLLLENHGFTKKMLMDRTNMVRRWFKNRKKRMAEQDKKLSAF